MPLPASISTVSVHGRILTPAGAAAVGRVLFTVPVVLRDTTGNVLVGPSTVVAPLDSNGEFTVVLPATDDPQVTPSAWVYEVRVDTDAWHEDFAVSLPEGGPYELADLAPATTPTELVIYALASHTHAGSEHTHAGADVTSGTVAYARLPVGTTSSTVAAGDDSRITGAAQKSANLSDLASASTSRTNLGLGGAAVLNVGTTAGTVAAGDDSRITGAAQKASNLSDLASASTARSNLALGGAAVLNVGTAAGTVAAGDHAHSGSSLVVRKARLTAGDITAPNTSGAWQLVSGTTVSIPAAVGDYVELTPVMMTSGTSGMFLDWVVAVSAAIARAMSSDTATPGAEGVTGLYPQPSSFRTALGTWGFEVEAGHLDGGNVVFQLAANAAGAGTIYRSATYPLILVARNFGAVDFA